MFYRLSGRKVFSSLQMGQNCGGKKLITQRISVQIYFTTPSPWVPHILSTASDNTYQLDVILAPYTT